MDNKDFKKIVSDELINAGFLLYVYQYAEWHWVRSRGSLGIDLWIE